MSTIGVWGFLCILYQTILCTIISWLTLSCKLSPDADELAEVTLVKLLYLYDPVACGRIHFYNYTTADVVTGAGTAVVWPVKNEIATAFRGKMKIWLALHIVWTLMAVVNISQGSRACGYYATLLPFTLTGLALLVIDLMFCGLFLADVATTGSEAEILEYINWNTNNLHSINVTLQRPANAEDTSWVAVMLAYCSLRGVVQWVINFWLVKDTYFNGVAVYHRLRELTIKKRTRTKSVQMYRIRL